MQHTVYRTLNADIILINSHCLHDDESLTIPGYKVHKKNNLTNKSDGAAIAIKHSIKHKILDDFILDLMAVEIDTTR